MKLQRIECDRTGHIVLHYSNGERLSILWNAVSYSDNQGALYTNPPEDMGEIAVTLAQLATKPWTSTTVEIMGSFTKDVRILTAMTKRGWSNPQGYVSLEDLLDLLIELRNV